MAKTTQTTMAETTEAEALRAEVEALKAALAAKSGRITVKVGQGGTIAVYGLQRFPVSLHPEQWARLLSDAVVAEVRNLIGLSDKAPAQFAKLVSEAKARAEARAKAEAEAAKSAKA